MTKYYPYKPYNPAFPELFKNEKERLEKILPNEAVIVHIGSTAIPGVAGKGYIDIYIAVPKKMMKLVSDKLQELGYEYKSHAGVSGKRLFHQTDLPDKYDGTRRYHVHVTFPEYEDFQNNLKFRDYLIKHPAEAKKYSDIKVKACEEANKMTTKEEAKEVYLSVKSGIIDEIMAKIN